MRHGVAAEEFEAAWIDRIDLVVCDDDSYEIEVIPIRRRDFEEDRHTPGELAEAVTREGLVVYGR